MSMAAVAGKLQCKKKSGLLAMLLLVLLTCSGNFLTACQQEIVPLPETSAKSPVNAESKKSAEPIDEIVLSEIAGRNARIGSEPVRLMKYQQDIKTTGEIKADENRVFHINSMVPGRVVKDNVNLGDIIK